MVLKIERFFCFRLESTGIFIAWLGLIFHSILFLSSLPFFIYVLLSASFGDDRAYKIALVLIAIAISCFCIWVFKSLLFGIQTRKSRMIRPYLVLVATTVIFDSIYTLFFNFFNLSIGAILLVTYFWLCMYTLYKNIQAEELRQGPPLDEVKTSNEK